MSADPPGHDHDGVIGLPCARCQIVTEAEGEKP